MKKFAKSQIYFHFFLFFRCLFYLNLTVPPYAHNCCFYRIVGTKWCGVVWHAMPFDTTWRAATGITDRREYCSKQWRWQRNFPKFNSVIKTLKQTHKIRKFFLQIIIKFFLGFFDIQYFFITKQSVLWSTKMFVNNSIATTDQEATHTHTHRGALIKSSIDNFIGNICSCQSHNKRPTVADRSKRFFLLLFIKQMKMFTKV